MKKVYVKPIIVAIEDLSLGFYLGSVSFAGFYTIDASIVTQTPTEGRTNYIISINATHAADHTREAQTLYINFNQPVNYVSCGVGSLLSGNNTSSLAIAMQYHQNPNDKIGFSDLTVESDPGLSITGVQITD